MMTKERDSLPSVAPLLSHDDWIFSASWFPWKQLSGNLTGGTDKRTTSSPECETHARGHRIKGKEEPRTSLCVCVFVCHVTVFNESVYLYVFFPHCSLFLCSLLQIVFFLFLLLTLVVLGFFPRMFYDCIIATSCGHST